MIICKNCGNEVDENEPYCHYCSHDIYESLEDYQISSINNIQKLNTKKRRLTTLLVAGTIITCFCIPILMSHKLNHNVALLKQSSNKKYNNVAQIHYNNKINKKVNQQVETSKVLLIRKHNKKQL
ncbi:zinc-ribbon domain-containing protein [Clostridium estertheticum]|uniref:zinc-ribbon domain-containing protein n=1 Tax=Clostridium estertheticum TaxID=238834 RepID=UPI001C0D0E51|nr:zinc-ribbon domain-containing protein [Clostridium estertheticum]MBU3215670.1 zinc-ribbon domain-containing protein [Clostridium estertheticum]WAG56715.1 zinc-ribbon domain-containing protein [Clostridium estertheticum]